MTSKLTWIFFVPFTVAAVFFKLAQTLLPDGTIFGLSDMLLDYLVIGCVAVIFLAAFILCVVDRRISQYYAPHRNIPAGIIGLLLAVVCAADGANRIYLAVSAGVYDVLDMIEAALLLLASIVFIVMGLTHSFVNRDNKNFALFNVMPALLCAMRLVRCFIGFTTISIRLADVTLMICYVFATLFFFNLAVTISLTEAKHAVKSCFIFGFPAIAALLARGIFAFVTSFDTRDIFANAGMVELVLMGLYIFAFMTELTIFIKDRDHVAVMTPEEAAPQEPDEETARQEDTYFVTGMDEENRYEADESYLTSPEFNDYLYHVVDKPSGETEEQQKEQQATQSDPTGYITEVVEEHTGKTPVMEIEDAETPDGEAPIGYDERLDEIDKLILELNEEYKD